MAQSSTNRVRFTLNGRQVELDSATVADALEGVIPEPLRKHSVEVNGVWFPVLQAFEVATGVSRRSFISHAARRHMAALGFAVAGEVQPREQPAADPGRIPASASSQPDARQLERLAAPGMVDLLLVTCVKEKLRQPAAAQDLYVSPLFRKERAYAEQADIPWFILSAEHGLVAPDEWLAPYERYLPDTPSSYRKAWGEWAAARLDLLSGGLSGRTIEIHAGSEYVDALRDPVAKLGGSLIEPLAGLSFGERLAWYDGRQLSKRSPATKVDPHFAASDFCASLSNSADAVSPTIFLERGSGGLKVAGLYSWWVDEGGARDLSTGLGHGVQAGMIYAGLAGATRWPSGKRSTNTLWSRIAGMHLGKRHEFSTFRRTIGSVLASASGAEAIDEAALTVWMHAHLRVLAVPFEDADTLGTLEEDVLARLDPPLNLKGMSASPVRKTIKALRVAHAQR